MLQKFITEIRTGQRVGSVLSRQMGKPLAFNNQEAWQQIRKELQDVGITSEIFNEHQHLIVSLIKQAVSGGGLEEIHELSRLEPIEDEVVFPTPQVGQQWERGPRKPNTDSALIQQATRGHVDLVAKSLKAGNDFNHTGDNGETALMRTILAFSRTPKFLDISHALELLEPESGENASRKQHFSKADFASMSESIDPDSEAESESESELDSSEQREQFETSADIFSRLLRSLILPFEGNVMSAFVGAMIVNRKSRTTNTSKRCCSCFAPFLDVSTVRLKSYQCRACGRSMDIKCKATLSKDFKDENTNLCLDICRRCFTHILDTFDSGNENRSSPSETSNLIKLMRYVRIIDLPSGFRDLRDGYLSELGSTLAGELKDTSNGLTQQNAIKKELFGLSGSSIASGGLVHKSAEPTSDHVPAPKHVENRPSNSTGQHAAWSADAAAQSLTDSSEAISGFHKAQSSPMIWFPEETQSAIARTLSLAFRSGNDQVVPRSKPASSKSFMLSDDFELSSIANTILRDSPMKQTAGVIAHLEHPNWGPTWGRINDIAKKTTVTPLGSQKNFFPALLNWKKRPIDTHNTTRKTPNKATIQPKTTWRPALSISNQYKGPIDALAITQTKRSLLKIMKMLLQAEADTEIKNIQGYTALAIAAQIPRPLESLLVCQLLIQHGADIDAAGFHGTTILMRAAAKNQEHIVVLLLEHGVDVTARDENGHAAWHWATRFGRSKRILEMLREHGGCVERGDVYGLKESGNAEEEGNPAKNMLPLLVDYVYSVEVPEKRHTAKEPDADFWDEWLDMDKFS